MKTSVYEAASTESLRQICRELREGRGVLVPVDSIPVFMKRLNNRCQHCGRQLQPDGLGTRGCSPAVNETCDRALRTAVRA